MGMGLLWVKQSQIPALPFALPSLSPYSTAL